MAAPPRRKPAPRPIQPPAGPVGRDWKVAVLLGVLLGQAGYLYTRQGKRFAVTMLMGTLAVALACAACYNQMPPLDIEQMTNDPQGWAAQVSAGLGLVVAVSVINNLACAIDLYLQVSKVN